MAPPTENIAYRQRQVLHAEGKSAHRAGRGGGGAGGLLADPEHRHHGGEIARALIHHRGLPVITNNLHVANILADNPECEVIVAGGVLRSRGRGIIGEATVEFIRQFKVDIGLIGISGIGADGTLRDY